MNLFWLIFSIALWGFVHSVLASLGSKEFFRQGLGAGFVRFYRLGYNIFAVISFLPILWLMSLSPDKILYSTSSPWSYLLLVGEGLAALMLLIAVLQTDVLSFMGLKQLFGIKESNQLVTNGFYRHMRHPLYTFGILLIWLNPSLSVNSFIVYSGLTLYILIGIYFEERKLLREFGEEYADYRKRTPMLIPGLVLGTKNEN